MFNHQIEHLQKFYLFWGAWGSTEISHPWQQKEHACGALVSRTAGLTAGFIRLSHLSQIGPEKDDVIF